MPRRTCVAHVDPMQAGANADVGQQQGHPCRDTVYGACMRWSTESSTPSLPHAPEGAGSAPCAATELLWPHGPQPGQPCGEDSIRGHDVAMGRPGLGPATSSVNGRDPAGLCSCWPVGVARADGTFSTRCEQRCGPCPCTWQGAARTAQPAQRGVREAGAARSWPTYQSAGPTCSFRSQTSHWISSVDAEGW